MARIQLLVQRQIKKRESLIKFVNEGLVISEKLGAIMFKDGYGSLATEEENLSQG